MLPLHLLLFLAPAPYSTLNRLNSPLFSESCLTRNCRSSIVDWTTLSWPWGCRCFLFWGGMFWQELAQKIRGYQEQIASLHSKCKMLTVKAKHATMLLTVSEVEGLSDGMDELSDEELPSAVSTASKQLPAHPSVVMVSGFFGHPDTHTCTHCMVFHPRFVCAFASILPPFPSRPVILKLNIREAPSGVLEGDCSSLHN